MSRSTDPDAAAVDALAGPTFREELHAIDAVIAGQGIGVVSDVLAARELATGELVKVLDLSLPVFGFCGPHCGPSAAEDHRRLHVVAPFRGLTRKPCRACGSCPPSRRRFDVLVAGEEVGWVVFFLKSG